MPSILCRLRRSSLVSHHLLAVSRDMDDDPAPSAADGLTLHGAAIVPLAADGSTEPDDAEMGRQGRRQSSSEGSSRQTARLETVSEDGTMPRSALWSAAASRKLGPALEVVSEHNSPQSGGAVGAADWRQRSAANDEHCGVSIEMVSRGEAGQRERAADSS